MRRSVTFFLQLFCLLAFATFGSARAEPLTIVAFGDSLTAGYQLPPQEAFPAQLQDALNARGYDVNVVNAGVSGDTTATGLARLDWSIPQDADAVIVEFGGNDALRALPPEAAGKNLDAIVSRLTERGTAVLVAGMRAPRNLGEDYAARFDPIFAEIAEKHGALYYPFFLDGIPIGPETVLPDGLHPTGKGVAIIVERILPAVEQLIARAKAS
ncbi:arylesterase [Stappia albiluteola]|uniref:arylesterase n=1 Tax=Stappia albiluteola TaxID=2758565 RepID=UPI001F465D32|nr:arylesterase [Stappia albiluteola]